MNLLKSVLVLSLLFLLVPASAIADNVPYVTATSQNFYDGQAAIIQFTFYNPTDDLVTFMLTTPGGSWGTCNPDGDCATMNDQGNSVDLPAHQIATFGIFEFDTTGSDDKDNDAWSFDFGQQAYSWKDLITQQTGTGQTGDFTITFYDTPEPGTLSLVAFGSFGLAGYLRRNFRRIY